MKTCFVLVFILLFTKILYGQSAPNSVPVLLDYLQKNGKAPDDYVIGKLKDHSVILLGESHALKDNLDFVAALIPKLYKAGVYNIGMEFGASEDQSRLDSLINALVYDEQLARDLMFNYNVGWAYKEYTDIYQAAWTFNHSLPSTAKKFRILNISYKYDWSHFTPPRTPQNMSEVFMKGTTDKYRADLIEREIILKKEKIVILTGTPHAYTRYQSCSFEFNADNFCHYDDGWFGIRLYKKYPKEVFDILLHQPFYNFQNKKPVLLSPANGQIEVLMDSFNYAPVGFDLFNSPVGSLSDSSSYSLCHPGFTMADFFDGYIFLKPFSKMRGCTFDSLFFAGKSWEQVQQQLPDPDWRGKPKSLEDYIGQIKSFVDMPMRFKGLDGY